MLSPMERAAAATEELLTELRTKTNLTEYEQRMLQINTEFADIKGAMPVTPNVLVDSYLFSGICDGQINTPVALSEAFGGKWSASLSKGGSVIDGTATLIPRANFSEYGIQPVEGDALHDIFPYADHASNVLWGSDFNVLLLDFSVSVAGNGFNLPVQYRGGNGPGTHYRGTAAEFSILANVLEQSGDTKYKIASAYYNDSVLDDSQAGQGWKHHHYVKENAMPNYYNPSIEGLGSMKVALALPYWGMGDHGGKFLWADAVSSAEEALAGRGHSYMHHMTSS